MNTTPFCNIYYQISNPIPMIIHSNLRKRLNYSVAYNATYNADLTIRK